MSDFIHFAEASQSIYPATRRTRSSSRKSGLTTAPIFRRLVFCTLAVAFSPILAAHPAAAQNVLNLMNGDNVAVSGSGTTGIYQGQAINNGVSTYSASSDSQIVNVSSGSAFTLRSGGSVLNTYGLVCSGISNSGTTTIIGGTIAAFFGISNSGTLTISGGTIGNGIINEGDMSRVIVSGGSISGGTGLSSFAGSVTVSGGTITGKSVGLYINSGSVTVSGGTIIGSGVSSIYGTPTNLTVTGGIVPSGLYLVNGTTVITGGTISLGITEVAEDQTTSSPAAVYITGGNISGELVASNGGAASSGSTIDLFGSFTATDDNGKPIASPITNTDGTITGTLLNGQKISVSYSALGGTIEFNVGTPPLTITEVRLGIPNLVTSGSSRILEQSVYVKGTGVGTVSGYWFEDDNKTQPVPQTNVDLSSGKWIKLADFQDVLLKKHTLQFVANSQASSTEDIAITGFIPSRDGWNFPNDINKYTTPPNYNFIDRLFYKFDGFCEGFAQSARDYYIKYPTAPQPRYGSTRAVYSLLLTDQLNGNAWWQKYDDSTGFENCLSIFRDVSTYNDVLDEEAGKLQTRIQDGDPCVIDIFTLQTLQQFINNQGEQGHAVVGTAAFFSDNIYKADTQREINTMHLFSIYDPNNPGPGADSEYVGSFDTGDPTPYFVFLGYDYSSYNFGLWLENTYHYTKTNF